MSVLKAIEADRQPKPRALPPDTQQVCIDLPGEEIKCVVYKPKLEIMLRKHRDVIFDIQLFKGMSYTVEADQSDFYNARDKKIVLRRLKQSVSFKDGERLHLWVGREFKGALILKSNGKVLGRYEPNALDPLRYDADPKTKPAPLMVVMKNEPAATTAAPRAGTAQTAPLATPNDPLGLGAAKADLFKLPDGVLPQRNVCRPEDEQSMHVVEVKPTQDVPAQVAAFFKQGGEQTAIDTAGIMTRNWLLQQITGSAAFIGDNREWIKDLWEEKFYLQKVIHKSGPKWYIVFKGNAGLRQVLKGTRYGVENAKVIAITAGAGSAAGMRHAAWGATKGAFQKAGLLALVFTITLDTAEWLGDYEQRDPKTGKPKKDFFDLAFKIGVDVAKAGVSAAIGSVVMAALVGFGVVTGGLAVVVGAIFVAVAVGLVLDALDKKTGATDSLGGAIRKAIEYLKSKPSSDYTGYDGAADTAIAGWGFA